MEPTIYKPGAYKSPGIYKGAGGIYKGRGVYNDGEGGNGGDFVEIGGRKYPFVKIGNRYWITENLDFKFDGLVIGSASSSKQARANYYNNNEAEFGENGKKWGLLYNYKAVEKLKQINFDKNFRLPNNTDIYYLSHDNAPLTLISALFGGTNETGFNCFLSGAYFDNNFLLGNDKYYSWTEETAYFFNINLSGTTSGYTTNSHGMSVRLCANV